jgi:hypothetical protein
MSKRCVTIYSYIHSLHYYSHIGLGSVGRQEADVTVKELLYKGTVRIK